MVHSSPRPSDTALRERIVACRACPRLVQWREEVAEKKVRRFLHESYWGKPVPSFGPVTAALAVVGLAPAAHGANRTGRMFTGDSSGDWLFRALHAHGFCTRPQSLHAADGLELSGARITAVAHCAPPQNTLTPEEIRACAGFLEEECALMRGLRVVVALGRLAYDRIGRIPALASDAPPPRFAHGAEYRTRDGIVVIASYHPSRQNTQTGRLTRDMLDAVFHRARAVIGRSIPLPATATTHAP